MRYALPLLCLFAGPVCAQDLMVVSPIYSQLLAVPTPANFVAGHEEDKYGFYELELAPKGETMDVWTQMITLTGAKEEAPLKTVEQIAAEFADGYKAACPTTFSSKPLPTPTVRGVSEVFSGYLGCGNTGKQSEAMVYLVLKGTSEIYTVQWAERGPMQAKPMEPDMAVWGPRAEALAKSRVCNKVAGEKAPYPSCTQ